MGEEKKEIKKAMTTRSANAESLQSRSGSTSSSGATVSSKPPEPKKKTS